MLTYTTCAEDIVVDLSDPLNVSQGIALKPDGTRASLQYLWIGLRCLY